MNLPKIHTLIRFICTIAWLSASMTALSLEVAGEPKREPKLVVQSGHGGNIRGVALSSDSSMVASAGEDHTMRLWDRASGRELRSFVGHTDVVTSVTFSSDDKSVVTGSEDRTVRIWELSTGKLLQTFTSQGEVESVRLAPNGKIVAGGGEHVMIVDAATGKMLRFISAKSLITDVAFSPTGKAVATAEWSGAVKIWDTTKGDLLRTIEQEPVSGMDADVVQRVVFSPDGRLILSSGRNGDIRLWDVATGNLLRVFRGHRDTVRGLAFFPDGKTVVSGSSDSTVRLWNVATGEESGFLTRDWNGEIWCVDVSRDQEVLAFAGRDGIVRVRNLNTQSVSQELAGVAVEPIGLALSPEGKNLVSAGRNGTFQLWDISVTGRPQVIKAHDDIVASIAYSSDGKLLATGGGDARIRLWDTENNEVLVELTGHAGAVYSLAFSPNNATLASGSADGTIRLWDIGSGTELRRLGEGAGYVTSVVYSPSGKLLASASLTDDVRIWDVAKGSEVSSIASPDITGSVVFSPDGKLLALASKNVDLIDAETGKRLNSLRGHPLSVNDVAFSPDGRMLASAGHDHSLKLWDTTSGRELHSLTGHEGAVNKVMFFQDGKMLASVGDDNAIRLWRVSDGTHLGTLYSFTDGSWVVTDPEGRFDTADLEEINGLHWVTPDDPFTPVPLEAFMKEYYEPRLLARILNGEKLKPVRALMDLNRVQPEVRITKVAPDGKDPERALVEVEVTGAKKDYERDGKKSPMTTAVHDLRLFRDGQLVGYVDGQIAKAGDQPYRKTFSVHLPSAMGGKDITFSAYAFNDDRVKSATSRQIYQVPATVTARKGNAYLIHMGVNRFDNPAWDLKFAANDAKLMRQSLSAKLQKTGAYRDIIPVSLISDGEERHADKALLHAVLDRLAGKPASPLLKDLKDAEQIQPATPDDLVLITFAGHGYADGNGNFYLLTQDTGKGNGKQVDEDLLRRSISSEELSQWLKDIDAGDMTLIVDACQSAASVQGKDFKPGPMGSRGLGQLSFDKGMRILAASQADEYALENDRIKQGLLSFALVTNGIEDFEADHEPKDQKIMLDEWLRYGVSRVPGLVDEVKTGKVKVSSRGGDRGAVRVSTTGTGKPRPAQQPALFDFAKKRRQVEVAGQ